jgi:hypothetical protein
MHQVVGQHRNKQMSGNPVGYLVMNRISTKSLAKADGLAKSPNCPIVISTNGRNINSNNWLRRKISR